MPTTAKFKNLIQYTILAATTAKNIAETAQVPFLDSTSALCLSITKCIEITNSNKEECAEIMEHIHGILCIIVQLHSTSEVKGILPMTLLYDIAKFTECVQVDYEIGTSKVFTVLNGQPRGTLGKIKGLFRQPEAAERLETCRQELSRMVELFKAQVTVLIVPHSQFLGDRNFGKLGNNSVAKFWTSSGSFGLLPASPQIFHGREAELQDVVNILIQDSAHIAILGAGGMGKTSLATAALHNPQVEAKYSHQYFVPCHSSPTCTELAVTIADHIGLEKGSNMAKKIAHHFAHAPPSLLILDNLETPWESLSSRSEVEEFLSLLTDVPHLGLMITLRGAERPSKVKWTKPFLAPLKPLSDVAAWQTFIEVADDSHDDASIKALLELTGNLPLAVSLIASVAGSEGCAQALSRWKLESTRMLSEGYDQRSSLDISIMLSYTSSRMTPGAQELLSILSMLPDGLTDQANLPIINILSCKTTLIQTSLAFVDQDLHLKVLVPIREHILHVHPPANSLKLKLRQHFHRILELYNEFKNLNVVDIFPKFHGIWATSTLFSLMGLIQKDSNSTITLGMQHFKSKDPLEQARWYLALGMYFQLAKSDFEEALKYNQKAHSLADSIGYPTVVVTQALSNISSLLSITGQPLSALTHAKEAYQYAAHMGNIYGQAVSFSSQARCHAILANYQHVQFLLQKSRDMLAACGQQESQLGLQILNNQAEIYLLKSEYLESRKLQVAIASSCQPTSYNAILANLNIAFVDLATGAESKSICQNVDNCRAHLKAIVYGLPRKTGCLIADYTAAELCLQDGDHVMANSMFQKFVISSQELSSAELALQGLTKLADLSTEMNNIMTTLQWVGVFMSLALKYKDKGQTMQAFRCLGQLFAAEGDNETAISLFNVALDGFTLMDVHRWRADCMVRIADILNIRGEVMNAVELWKAARPLFERSSQMKDIIKIDAKLVEVGSAFWKKLHVPGSAPELNTLGRMRKRTIWLKEVITKMRRSRESSLELQSGFQIIRLQIFFGQIDTHLFSVCAICNVRVITFCPQGGIVMYGEPPKRERQNSAEEEGKHWRKDGIDGPFKVRQGPRRD
ncbi:hypothetical protein C8J57DRAFT_1573985 [Mycena rebaudengoi]|nr:hypothetical protein C8J57DRAFT_1573985 [Mycena rebaudengoi]